MHSSNSLITIPVALCFLHCRMTRKPGNAICKATVDADQELLNEALTLALGMWVQSPLLGRSAFSFRRPSTKRSGAAPFSLSLTFGNGHLAWDVSRHRTFAANSTDVTGTLATAQHHVDLRRRSYDATQTVVEYADSRPSQVPSTFSTYTMNPIRIKVLVPMRAQRERTEPRSEHLGDPDKSHHFTLPLELGIILFITSCLTRR
jgi:hypothetical protein